MNLHPRSWGRPFFAVSSSWELSSADMTVTLLVIRHRYMYQHSNKLRGGKLRNLVTPNPVNLSWRIVAVARNIIPTCVSQHREWLKIKIQHGDPCMTVLTDIIDSSLPVRNHANQLWAACSSRNRTAIFTRQRHFSWTTMMSSFYIVDSSNVAAST